MVKILVTGACGFIGTSLCEELLIQGFEVLGLDSFTTNYSVSIKRSNQSHLNTFENFTLIESDLLSIDLDPILKEVNLIFHLAGQPSVSNSWALNFQTYSDRNIVATQKLLYSIEKTNKPSEFKLVFASSSSIYGDINTGQISEDDKKFPISPYGVSKLAAENLVTLYGTELGINTVSLRYFTVFGPRQRPDMAFNKIVSSIFTGQDFSLYGDGSQTRDFTYVSDIVRATMSAGFTTVEPGSIFNIGGGAPTSLNHAIQIIESITNKKVKIQSNPIGLGNPTNTSANCSKAKDILNWEPIESLTTGLEKQIKWHTRLI
jgi:UDP-glucose 4-epimerase